jgi:hypothetical protein
MWTQVGGSGFSSSFVSHRSVAFEDFEDDDD